MNLYQKRTAKPYFLVIYTVKIRDEKQKYNRENSKNINSITT